MYLTIKKKVNVDENNYENISYGKLIANSI